MKLGSIKRTFEYSCIKKNHVANLKSRFEALANKVKNSHAYIPKARHKAENKTLSGFKIHKTRQPTAAQHPSVNNAEKQSDYKAKTVKELKKIFSDLNCLSTHKKQKQLTKTQSQVENNVSIGVTTAATHAQTPIKPVRANRQNKAADLSTNCEGEATQASRPIPKKRLKKRIETPNQIDKNKKEGSETVITTITNEQPLQKSTKPIKPARPNRKNKTIALPTDSNNSSAQVTHPIVNKTQTKLIETHNRIDKNKNKLPYTQLLAKNGQETKFTATLLNSIPAEVLYLKGDQPGWKNGCGYSWDLGDISCLNKVTKKKPLSEQSLTYLGINPNEVENTQRSCFFGKGSFGSVKFALLHNPANQEEVHLCAAKKIKLTDPYQIEGKEELLQNVKKEAWLQRQLPEISPAIFGVVDTIDKKGQPEAVVFMDQAKGVQGTHYIDNESLDFKHKKHMALNLIQSIRLMHDRGIVHSDLKWDNITVDPTTLELQILDYGLATDKPTILTYYSKDYLYHPPEFRHYKHHQAVPVDVYSLGVMLTDLFNDYHSNPYIFGVHADGEANWLHSDSDEIVREKLVRVLNQTKLNNKPLEDLIIAMINPNPAKRPSLAYVEQKLQQLKPQKSPRTTLSNN